MFRLLIFGFFTIFLVACNNTNKKKEAEYSLLKGVNYSQKGDLASAMSEFQISYDANPENPILLKEMGYLYYQIGDYNKTAQLWEKALKISEFDVDVMKNLITLYSETGDYEKALKLLNNNSIIGEEYSKKIRGVISYRKGDINLAYQNLKEVSLEAYDCNSYLIYLECLETLNLKNELYYSLKNGYTKFNNDKKYILEYSDYMGNNFENYKESEKILLKYSVENGKDDEIILRLSMLYLKMGEKEKSEDVLKLSSKETI